MLPCCSPTEQMRNRLQSRTKRVRTYLVDGLECTRRELHFHLMPERVGLETLGLDVGKPCPPSFVFRVRDVVTVLFDFPMEETEL
jgi:hypothetical protein